MVNLDAAANAASKPDVPPDGQNLDIPAQELDSAAKTATGTSRRLLLGLLLDVQNARHDAPAAAAVARQLQDLGVSAGSAGAGAIAEAEQETRIALAGTAVNEQKYDQAIAMIDSSAAMLTDPARQSDGLFVKARALEGKAAGGGADAWKDAALAYMRVYVDFHDGPGADHAAAALMATARIEDRKLADPRAALALYQKVVSEYKDTNEARQAAVEAGRLGAISTDH
jgi:hypothetical protein